MSDILSTVKESFEDAVELLSSKVSDLSASVPVSRTTQALVVGVVVGAVGYLIIRKKQNLPPGPLALPLVGNISLLMGKEPGFKALVKMIDRYGPVITIYLGPLRCVTLNRLDVIKEALVTKGADFAGRPPLHSMAVLTENFKDIAFAPDSATWKLHRKIAMHALRLYMKGQHLESAVHEVVSMTTERMLAENAPFNPMMYMMNTMFHIISTICFGECKSFDDPDIKRLADLFDQLSNEMGNGFWEDVIPPLRKFPTKKFRKFESAINEFLAYIYARIGEHRKTFSPDHIRDIVDSVLHAQKEAEKEESPEVMAMFTDTHVGETISDIFGAGVDTSRMTLYWALLFMAGLPEVQKKVREEINRVTGSRMPGVSDLPHLVYTTATLYEIMRLGIVVPFSVPHQTLCDTSVAGYNIPEGTMVLVNLWAVHNDPKEWDSPSEFRPERFIDGEGKLMLKPEGWMPFSAGRRACLGESVAKPELLLILACLMKRCTVSLPPGDKFDPVANSDGMFVNLPKPYKIVMREA